MCDVDSDCTFSSPDFVDCNSYAVNKEYFDSVGGQLLHTAIGCPRFSKLQNTKPVCVDNVCILFND